MARSISAQRTRTFEMAAAFLEETRRDIERAVAARADLPPRIRMVHERPGHATPEYRTLAVPIPEDSAGASPEVLSTAIARFAKAKRPTCLLLTLDVVSADETGAEQSLLIAEARDHIGTRLYLMQPFRVSGETVDWEEPLEGGWQDPGGEEMILDAAFGPSRGG